MCLNIRMSVIEENSKTELHAENMHDSNSEKSSLKKTLRRVLIRKIGFALCNKNKNASFLIVLARKKEMSEDKVRKTQTSKVSEKGNDVLPEHEHIFAAECFLSPTINFCSLFKVCCLFSPSLLITKLDKNTQQRSDTLLGAFMMKVVGLCSQQMMRLFYYIQGVKTST